MLCTEISNNKHILCGCVVSCLFAWLFVFFLKKLFVCVLSACWSFGARDKLSYW